MDINAIADAAASALAAAMATDAWKHVRTRAGQAFGQGRPAEEQSALEELDSMYDTVSSAPEVQADEVRHEVKTELRGQIRSRIRSDPSFAAEFSALAEEISATIGHREPRYRVSQRGKSQDDSTFYQIGHDFQGRDGR